jgi:hypothetical protein
MIADDQTPSHSPLGAWPVLLLGLAHTLICDIARHGISVWGND